MTIQRKIKVFNIIAISLLVLQILSYLGQMGKSPEPVAEQSELIGYYLGYNILIIISIILFIRVSKLKKS
jgi:hypothetical protein